MNWSRQNVRVGLAGKGGICLGRRTFAAELAIGRLREAEVLPSHGDSVGEASRKLGTTEQT